MSSAAVFVLLQATAFSGGVGDLLRHTGPVAKVVLVILAIFSLVSWAIILYKGLSLRRAYSQSVTFLDVFRRSSKFSEVNSVCVQLRASPLVGVFQAGYTEVNQQVRGPGVNAPATGALRMYRRLRCTRLAPSPLHSRCRWRRRALLPQSGMSM